MQTRLLNPSFFVVDLTIAICKAGTEWGDWPCVFPFSINDVTHDGCVKDAQDKGWCPENVDLHDNAMKWRECRPGCPTTESE